MTGFAGNISKTVSINGKSCAILWSIQTIVITSSANVLTSYSFYALIQEIRVRHANGISEIEYTYLAYNTSIPKTKSKSNSAVLIRDKSFETYSEEKEKSYRAEPPSYHYPHKSFENSSSPVYQQLGRGARSNVTLNGQNSNKQAIVGSPRQESLESKSSCACIWKSFKKIAVLKQ